MRDEHGFTLMEVLVAMLVSSVIMTALSTATFRLTRFQDNNNSQITANRNAENALTYIAADAQRAQVVYGPDGNTSLSDYGTVQSSATMRWFDYSTSVFHKVKYELLLSGADEGRIQRTFDTDPPAVVARGIDALDFAQDPPPASCLTCAGRVTVRVTAESQSQVRDFNLQPRPQQ